jgi:putative transcriptional regulator
MSEQLLIHDGATMTKKTKNTKNTPDTFDWSRFDAMTDEEVHAAALADPDAQPWTEEQLDKAKRTPRVKIIRRVLRLTQEEFADQVCIPIGTLRDWEQGRKEPDQAARAYLLVIASDPAAVRKALKKHPHPQPA